jgi:dephospho-CoA kinase
VGFFVRVNPNPMKPIRIALTGGIATGKSTVASMFEDLGAIILDADQVARQVVQPGHECWKRLYDLLGQDCFDEDGQLKRRELRGRIVENQHLRSQINAIFHPSIMASMEGEWEKLKLTHSGPPVALFDIPLLFESHLQNRFERVILVYVPRHIQLERLMARDGLSAAEAQKTLSMQLPIESKKALSHMIIDNSGDLESTRCQVASIWKELTTNRAEDPIAPSES